MAEQGDEKVIRLQANTTISGVVVPTWFATLFLAMFAASLLTLSVLYQRIGEMRIEQAARDAWANKQHELFKLHAQDIENVLIRQEQARRDDFAPWHQPAKPAKEGE